MRVAVTGATGFLGAHVVRVLLEEGHAVRALIRPAGERGNLEGLEVEVLKGDLADGRLPEGFPGDAELLIHLAAAYSENPADELLLWQVNVHGTEALLEAARRDGLPRLVHTSTMGTCAPAVHGAPASEADHVAVGPGTSTYVRTKLEGERRALQAEGLEVVVVNPAAPVGAWDHKPTVTGARIREVVLGRWPRLLAGPVNHVPARGCARGILLAGVRGRPGERYLLGGENLPPRDFLERLAAAADRPPPRRTLLDRLLRRGLPTPGSLAIDHRKARDELGYEPGDLDLAFREAAEWFRGRAAAAR